MTKVSLAEAAVKLGVSVRTLRRRIKEGLITPALENGKYYMTGSDFAKLANMTRQFVKPQMTGSSGPSRVIVVDKASMTG
jgi:hypothetical protein